MLEIGLVIWAWRRGWKAIALIPMGITWFLVIMTALFGGESAFMAIIVIVVIEFGVLIYMIAKGRKEEDELGVYHHPAGSPDIRVYDTPEIVPAASVNNTPAITIPYQMATPASPVEIATTLVPTYTAKLVLPNNSEITIKEAEKTIGRHDLDRAIPPEELKYISRRHMIIKKDDDQFYVEDWNSSNSTKVNDINITGQGKRELKDGDRIKLADKVTLQFKMSSVT